MRLCYGIYIWLNLLKRGYRKCILTIWIENSEKSLAKAQQSQLYCLQQTVACSRLSDSGEDAKEKGPFSIQRTRPSRNLEQATGFHGQPRGVSRVLGKTLFQRLWKQTTKVRDWGFLSCFLILRSVIFFLFTIGRFGNKQRPRDDDSFRLLWANNLFITFNSWSLKISNFVQLYTACLWSWNSLNILVTYSKHKKRLQVTGHQKKNECAF